MLLWNHLGKFAAINSN
jgi:Phospholipid-translocating P-type ATPase C-terminal